MKKMFLLGLLIATLYSCEKNNFNNSPNARISLSADTLYFDTVFTSVGSITQSFKVKNNNDQPILFNSIQLMGGQPSAYKININGQPGPIAQQVALAANDSLYIFVSVMVNPTSGSLPFIIADSIQLNYNGLNRYVQLQAYGQNAIFLRNQTISHNTTWNADLPYVILDGIKIDTQATLTIAAGTHIYSGAHAAFLVDGSLQVNGTKDEPVIFTGNRLDEPYANFPASWPGIYLNNSSKNNRITFAEIKNAYQALVAIGPSVNSAPKLILQQSIISNAFSSGLYFINSEVKVNNSLVYNCNYNVLIEYGGSYNLTNCSMATYSTPYLIHKTPIALLSNYTMQNGITYTDNLQATLNNCIFWSSENSMANELVTEKQGASTFNVVFNNCIYKAETTPSFATFNNCFSNTDPLFDSIDVANKIFNFHISNNILAPGLNQGISTVFAKDLADQNRTVGITDIGCYEKQ